jgi:UDP-N-acetylglucosamine 2-epimerase (non-hydrolysing)
VPNITHIVGARPNFMKAAPVLSALSRHGINQRLVHTGQHYDATMSDRFFQQLELPEPDLNLGVGSGSHAVQTADVMTRLEPELAAQRPELLVVYGDVNSTMAAALVAAKLQVPVAHVEAGLRSFDWTMPEEINRLVTDRLSKLLLTPSKDANENLAREGADPNSICLIGNVMIDSLTRSLPAADAATPLRRAGLAAGDPFVLVTLHRPSSVDDPGLLRRLTHVLSDIARDIPVIFPVHPRTRAQLQPTWLQSNRLLLTEPLSYFEFIGLEERAALVITDSGGVQEETTYLGVPCLTVRDNTERPVTVTAGTNRLIGRDPEALRMAAREELKKPRGAVRRPELWDGHAGERAAAAIVKLLS